MTAEPQDALDWAGITINLMISDMQTRAGKPELTVQMIQAAAMVGIGYELRKIQQAIKDSNG